MASRRGSLLVVKDPQCEVRSEDIILDEMVDIEDGVVIAKLDASYEMPHKVVGHGRRERERERGSKPTKYPIVQITK